MEPFRLRTDLKRAVIDGFALPLGIAPGPIKVPTPGYTVGYSGGQGEEPDTYSFYVAVSHERVAPIARRAMELLPETVCGIVEISSRDAYRPVDVYIGEEEVRLRRFLTTWRKCEPILLEDASIAAGANSENPFVELFLDQWKGLSIIVPLSMRDDVESILEEFDLEEVAETWPVGADNPALELSQIRPVLAPAGAEALDIDDVLMVLRRDLRLELNVDPDTNVDEAGRELGMTLWHAVVGVQRGSVKAGDAAGLSIWATAGSLNELEVLISGVLDAGEQWESAEVHTTDRVAYDERPEELSDLSPRRGRAEVHLVSVERYGPDPRE
ncbi:MAG: hypothetical protein ACYS1E_10785 [Planctomycetota bacterium]|jgi:hypothetical protein